MKAIFIHHSTGANLINQGNLRALLKKELPNLKFWDQGYNSTGLIDDIKSLFCPYLTGLHDSEGKTLPKDIKIPNNNTDPDGLENLFSLKEIMKFDVIIFKSCYPTTKITSDNQLNEYKRIYLKIRDLVNKNPEKKFIIITSPPLRKELTNLMYASRAREFINWLISKEYLENIKNLHVFNFFDLLAENKNKTFLNTLKREYCSPIVFDSHPNKKANLEIAPIFVNFLKNIL